MSKHTCRVCGVKVVRKPGPGRWPHYCSDQCRAEAGSQKRSPVKKTNSCLDCGTAIQSRSKRCTHCHLNRARSKRAYKSVPEIDCPVCGEVFRPYSMGSRGMTRTCSKPCGMRLAIREGTHNLQDGTQVGRDPEKRRVNGEKSNRKRRALKAGVPTEPYTRDEIAERDNYICWLCGDPVDMSLEWPDPDSPSIDHVVPLSRGGSDLKSNVKLAHLGENVARGNRLDWKAGESNGRKETVAAGESSGRFRDGSTAVLF